jgi:hypothetical protein
MGLPRPVEFRYSLAQVGVLFMVSSTARVLDPTRLPSGQPPKVLDRYDNPNGAGTVGPSRRANGHDLHPRFEPGRPRSAQPGRQALTRPCSLTPGGYRLQSAVYTRGAGTQELK